MSDSLAQLAERMARLDREGGWKGTQKGIPPAGTQCVRGISRDYEIKYPGQTLPVSRALPLNTEPGEVVNRNGHHVRLHKDGSYTDLMGRRIIANLDDVKRAEGATGRKHD